jgi:hypothetical protein
MKKISTVTMKVIRFSTRVTRPRLLDDKHVRRLRMMPESLSAAMEEGCRCELQEAYFANWNASRMVILYAMVDAA